MSTPNETPEKEDIEASEDLDIALHERSLTVLSTGMTRFPMESDAWTGYVGAIWGRLGLNVIDGSTAATVPSQRGTGGPDAGYSAQITNCEAEIPMGYRPSALERAFQLAREGRATDMVSLKIALHKEDYVNGQLDHMPALSKQLRAIMEAARPKPPGRQRRSLD